MSYFKGDFDDPRFFPQPNDMRVYGPDPLIPSTGGAGIGPITWGPSPGLDLSKLGVALKTKSDGSSTDYYKIPDGSKDLIDLIEFKNMNFAIGNIFKACFRLGEKADTDRAYDLRKIIFFAQRELDRISK